MGDGWNAGGINTFDHFRVDSRSELMAEAIVVADTTHIDATTAAAATIATARRTSYKNTMMGGSSRTVPLCLADGEYFFSTEFHTPEGAEDAGGPFSIGGRIFSESSWSFCGATGMLSDYTYVSIVDGACTVTDGWGVTAAPAATPVVGSTTVPTPSPDSSGGNNAEEGGEGDGDDSSLTDMEILGIGLGALAIAALAAAGGTYAQQKGWFNAAAGGGGGAAAVGAAAGGRGGGGAPDEFAP